MVELRVTTEQEGQRLNKFLMKYLNLAPSSFIYKMLRKKNIVLNDKRADGNEIISKDDSVKLYLSDETINKFRGGSVADYKDKADIQVLYRDKDIMAVHKAVGVLSQKAKADDYSINEAIVGYYQKHIQINELDMFKPSICNRLDRNTSGIILAGISLKGSRYLSDALKNRRADKYYYTICDGIIKKTINSTEYIIKDESSNKSTVITQLEYDRKKTEEKLMYSRIEAVFRPLSVSNGFTLVEVKLITGKSHQIRAQLSQLGYPIIGDAKYGRIGVNRLFRDKYRLKNQLLHAGRLELDGIRIDDPLPEYFVEICEGLGLEIKL